MVVGNWRFHDCSEGGLGLDSRQSSDMILRRRERQPEPPWRQRFDQARTLVLARTDDASVAVRLSAVESALLEATADRASLVGAIDQLGGHRAGDELKVALRRRPDPTAADSPQIISLRRRFESVQRLKNSLDDLDQRVAATLADLESYAAEVVESSVTGVGTAQQHLDALNGDAAALRAAHAELEAQFPIVTRDPRGGR